MKKPAGNAPAGFFFAAMDDKRKTAYRKILYNFLVSIRNSDVPSEVHATAIGRYAAPVAYALHNLALASANDFIGFDEAVFWQLIITWDTRFPELGIDGFRNMFELDLTDA